MFYSSNCVKIIKVIKILAYNISHVILNPKQTNKKPKRVHKLDKTKQKTERRKKTLSFQYDEKASHSNDSFNWILKTFRPILHSSPTNTRHPHFQAPPPQNIFIYLFIYLFLRRRILIPVLRIIKLS